MATFARQREAVRALAQAGADLNLLEDDRYDAVTIAAVADDEETLRVLLALGASAKQVTSRYDGTALIAAAHLGHDGRGAPADRRRRAAGPCQQPALDRVDRIHRAGRRRRAPQATLKALVDAGASLKLADRHGSTPLELARARGFDAMARILATAPAGS